MRALILAICLAMPALATAQDVTVTGGTLAGATADGVSSWKGIPYAAPPFGPLRWRTPQPPGTWEGARDATAFGNDCAQTPNPVDEAFSTVPFSEDCLYLNIWAPEGGGTGLPVLVWIHGGGYVTGGTSPAIYDGSAFARQGIVVVSLNYRLGRLGFFTHPALVDAGEGETGNFAYMDQIAALEWVRANIAAFGGDPGRVTIMGESAGGDSVAHLMTTPRAAGLYHQAIMLSGDGRDHVIGGLSFDDAVARGTAFAEAVGIAGDDPGALAALRDLPWEVLAEDLSLVGLVDRRDFFTATYAKGPIGDGSLVSGTPAQAMRDGLVPRVPVLIGSTTSDLPTNLPPLADPLAYFGPDRFLAAQLYPADDPGAAILAIGADITMHEPARFVARETVAAGQPAWLYRYDYVAEARREELAAGAPHASELAWAFDTVEAVFGDRGLTDTDRAQAKLFNGYLAAFVLTGDPNGGDRPAWPQFDRAAASLLSFDRTGGATFGPDPWAARLDLVEAAQDAKLYGVPPALLGTTWELVSYATGEVAEDVADPSRYRLTFSDDHRISLQADCNRGFARAGSPGEGRLRIGAAALTRMACPPGGRGEEFARALTFAAVYSLTGDQLRIEAMADGGSLTFRRVE
jgi:para-nitrobenzyl esterase